jgi:hypothetical protein
MHDGQDRGGDPQNRFEELRVELRYWNRRLEELPERLRRQVRSKRVAKLIGADLPTQLLILKGGMASLEE